MIDNLKDFWWYAFTSEGRDRRAAFWLPMSFSVAIWVIICWLFWWLDEHVYSPGEGMSIGLLFFYLPSFFILFWACSSGFIRRIRDVGFSGKWQMAIQFIAGILYLPFLIAFMFNGFKESPLSDSLFQLGVSGFFVTVVLLLLIALLPTDWALKRK